MLRKHAFKTNLVPLQCRRCTKTQINIRLHIPTLVYCEVFTNMCFSKDICMWRATRIHSFPLQSRLSVIKNNYTIILNRQWGDGNSHRQKKTGNDVLLLNLLKPSGTDYIHDFSVMAINISGAVVLLHFFTCHSVKWPKEIMFSDRKTENNHLTTIYQGQVVYKLLNY